MLKIFFTGATGFIGQALLQELIKNQDNFFICPVRDEKKATIKSDHIKYIPADPDNDFSEHLGYCDYVLHLAAELDSKNPSIDKINIGFTESLMAQCDKNKLNKFVFFSSITAQRKQGTKYSETKKEAEKLLKNSGLPYLIIRPTWVIGKNSRSFKNFLQYLKKFPIIPVIGSGKTLTQPILIDDLVAILSQLIFNENEINKTFEIGGEKPISYNDFISLILKKSKIKKARIHLPIFLCKLIAKSSNILSFDAISDFENDTKVNNGYLSEKFGFKPKSHAEIISDLIE